ncbi:MAG: hypothetical protein ACLSDQ_03070 [Adlercreutzia equolifaciens]
MPAPLLGAVLPHNPFDAIAEGPADLSASFAVLHLVQDLARAHIGSSLKSLEFLFTSGLF